MTTAPAKQSTELSMIQPVKFAEHESFVQDDTSFEVDVTKETLRAIGRIPMLTVAEEQRLARRIQVARDRLRRELLRNPRVVAECVDLLLGVLENKLRMDRILGVSLANKQAKQRLLQIVRLNMHTLTGLLERVPCAPGAAEFSNRDVAKVQALFDEVQLNTNVIRKVSEECGHDTSRSVQLATERYEDYRNQMVAANLRLAVSVAKKYHHSGMPLLDLIQEGSEGLLRAAEKFDPDRGFKFSTYAVWWIRQRIRSAVQEKSRVIRIGESAGSRVRNSIEQAAQDRGEDPRNVAFEDLPVSFANSSRKEDFRRTFYASRDILSLDRPVTARGEMSAADFIEAEEVDIDRGLVSHEQQSMLRDAFSVLTDREKHVLRLRFGLGDDGEHNLAEVGRILAVSRERVRQIEKNSLKKLQTFFGSSACN